MSVLYITLSLLALAIAIGYYVRRKLSQKQKRSTCKSCQTCNDTCPCKKSNNGDCGGNCGQ